MVVVVWFAVDRVSELVDKFLPGFDVASSYLALDDPGKFRRSVPVAALSKISRVSLLMRHGYGALSHLTALAGLDPVESVTCTLSCFSNPPMPLAVIYAGIKQGQGVSANGWQRLFGLLGFDVIGPFFSHSGPISLLFGIELKARSSFLRGERVARMPALSEGSCRNAIDRGSVSL